MHVQAPRSYARGGTLRTLATAAAVPDTRTHTPPTLNPPLIPQLRKAEAVVDNDAVWHGPAAEKRARMRAITYNNLGCLFKRRNMPQLALQVSAPPTTTLCSFTGRGASVAWLARTAGSPNTPPALPGLRPQYLQKALALEDNVQNSASTHLNICAAYSSLRKPKEVRRGARRALPLGRFLMGTPLGQIG